MPRVTARSVRIHAFGCPEALSIEDVEISAPGSGEVRLRIRAIGLKFVTAALAKGSLRPVIARTFPFERIVDAHRFLESGQQVGKVIVTV